MRFVHEEQEILGEIVEQRGGRLPLHAAVEVAGVVLDAVAVAELFHHLKVELGALFEALGFEQAVRALELDEAFAQFVAYVAHGADEVVAVGNVVAGRVDDSFGHAAQHLSGERVYLAYGVYLVAEELDVQGLLVFVGGDYLQHVAAHAEGASVEVVVVAGVLYVHEAADDALHGDVLPFFHRDDEPSVVLRRAEAIDAGDRGHDDDVAPREQGVRGGMAQLVDVVVDGRVFLDIGVRGRNVGFWLVVVVIADEVFHRVLREQGAELAVELGGQRLVVGEDERGAVGAGDDVGHGERLARTRDAEQDLVAYAGIEIRDQLVDGGRLVAHGRKSGVELEDGFGHMLWKIDFLGEIISPRPPYFAGRLGALRAPAAALRKWVV